ncbi:hypothetical protein K492DRAFT_200751, partial [Lichtheimia hyalospora FSU 10163]
MSFPKKLSEPPPQHMIQRYQHQEKVFYRLSYHTVCDIANSLFGPLQWQQSYGSMVQESLQKVKNSWQAVYSCDVTITVQNHCTRQMPGVGIVYDGATKEIAISAAKTRAVEDGSIKAFQSMGACFRVPDK